MHVRNSNGPCQCCNNPWGGRCKCFWDAIYGGDVTVEVRCAGDFAHARYTRHFLCTTHSRYQHEPDKHATFYVLLTLPLPTRIRLDMTLAVAEALTPNEPNRARYRRHFVCATHTPDTNTSPIHTSLCMYYSQS